MRLPALFLCLLLPVLAATQAPTQAAAQAIKQPAGTIAVEDSATQDAAIATRIRDILAELDGYEDVTVTVSSGIVTLRGTTLDNVTASRLSELTSRVAGVVAIENNVVETTDVAKRLSPAMRRFQARMTQAIAFAPLALVALGSFVVIVMIGFFIARRKQPWDRLAPNAFIADIYRQILRLAFGIAGLVVALDILGATALLSTILGAAGIIGLAIGFAVKDTVENFIASIMLSIRQPFRPNDSVEIQGDTGKVIRLTSRATILLSYDGNHIRIPNSTVFKSRIINYSRNQERRFMFQLSVASNADLAQARSLALETLTALPFVLKAPEVAVWIESVDDCWITLTMVGWIDQNATSIVLARGEAIRLTLAAFDAAGITAPEPTYRLLHVNAPDTAPPPGTPPGTPPAQTPHSQAPSPPPTPVTDVDATADKQLEQIVEQERAEEQTDLLRPNAEQE